MKAFCPCPGQVGYHFCRTLHEEEHVSMNQMMDSSKHLSALTAGRFISKFLAKTWGGGIYSGGHILSAFCPLTKTIHAEKGCAEICNFRMAASMFLRGHGIKARTHAHGEIAHFPTWCTIGTWKALSLQPHASQGLMMRLIGKCAFSALTLL